VVESLLLEEGIHFTEEDTPCTTECVIEVGVPNGLVWAGVGRCGWGVPVAAAQPYDLLKLKGAEPAEPPLRSTAHQVYSEDELDAIFRSALPDALVVVDFFKTDCPACKYMAPGFQRMCRSASEHAQHIIFVKVRPAALR